MSEFGSDSTTSHLPWREHRMERDTQSSVPQEHETQQMHSHLPSVYEHYNSPPVISEAEDDDYRECREWPNPGSHDIHGAAGSPHSQTSTGSIIGSPHSHPSSHHSDHRHSVDMSIGGSGQSSSSHGDHHMSLSERRQEKRKMKRFRLTHNQTRFLMSEFARQAHPDAAHRERLAREIPGLSARQVQVWFQNRRAKLKRMSSDDRERMMKSRALPEEFPILQTLHTYGGRMMGTPMASPTEYSPSPSMGYRGDPLRRRHLGEDDVVVSPTTPAFAGLSFNHTSSSSEMISPASSSAGERSSYLGYMTAPLGPQQHRSNPFSRPNDPFRANPSVPRLQLQDTPRSLTESTSSPLRSSTPYSGNPLDHGEYQLSPSGYPMQGLPFAEPPRSVPPETPQNSFVHSHQGPYTHPYPSPAPPSTQARPQSFPPPLTLSDFKYPQPPLTPHSGTMSGFSTAPLAPPQEFHIPQMSAPADATSFSSSYLTRGNAGSIGSVAAAGSPGDDTEARTARLSLGGKEYGHQRKRSSSHPPNFPHHREP